MTAREFIAAKRDGHEHTEGDLRWFVRASTAGEVDESQVSAWLMAAFLRGLNEDEIVALTMAMAESGDRLDLTGLPKPWLDKHSTGGVGDKTTIVLLPLLASCGLTMVKMSGKGLGKTGGTIDKLSAIPGLRLDLTPEEMIEQAGRIGIALAGQTPRLAPADGLFYRLRDTTATVESMPLICSSILSKKIAGGAEIVMLDVKAGSGAFMPDVPSAIALAESLVRIGNRCGLKVHAEVTDMDQPLGHLVGNALEVFEAIDVLKGWTTSGRFYDLCIQLAGGALVSTGLADDQDAGERLAREAITSGRALAKTEAWWRAQGMTVDVLDDPYLLPSAPATLMVDWHGEEGYIARFDANEVGGIVVDLGGGRQKKTDTIDLTVGLHLEVEVGMPIKPGDVLAVVHARDATSAQKAATRLARAVSVSKTPVEKGPLVIAHRS